MTRLFASLHKESLLLLRDWHALLVLFVMPSMFVLVMSLALQGQFAEQAGARLPGWITVNSQSAQARAFVAEILQQDVLALTDTNAAQSLSTNDRLFHIVINSNFDAALAGQDGEPSGVRLDFAPELSVRDQSLIKAAVQRAFAYFNTTLIAEEMGFDRDYARTELLKENFISSAPQTATERPSAVQQSVPAWLIFAMFFIAIPISTTVIQERQQKTLMRLQTFGMPLALVYFAKLLPYLVINLLQLMAMLAISMLLVPRLGGEALSLDVSLGALALVGVSTSMAALGFARLVAVLARSIEQATIISGASNILFAALGGIMIPRFVMPPAMQDLTWISPMAWALDGFLTVLVRGGSYAAVAGSSLALLAMGAGLVAAALLASRWRKTYD